MRTKEKIALFYKGLKAEDIMSEFIICIDVITALEEKANLWKQYDYHTGEAYASLKKIINQNDNEKMKEGQLSLQTILNQVSLMQSGEVDKINKQLLIFLKKERDLVYRIYNLSDAILNEQTEIDAIKRLGLHIAELFIDKTQTAIKLLNELSIRLSTPVACLAVCNGLENLKQRDPIYATHAALNFLSELRRADNYTQRIFQKQLQAIPN